MDAEELLELYEEGERDFQGLDLENIDLSGTDLSGANLIDANLVHADLSDANLRDANLSGSDLSDAYLNDSKLVRADLSSANLSDADLSGTNLTDGNLSGADLSGANLSGVDLSGVDLSGAKLNWVNLTGTIIDEETKLDDKWYFVWQIVNRQFNSLKQERYYQLSLFNSFHHDNYVGRDLSNSCLINSDITGLNLTFSILYRADCTNTNFTDTKLYCANFHSADLRGADFTNADLRYINLHGLDLTDSKTDGAKFTTFDDISCSWNQINDEQFEELCYDILIKQHNLKFTNIDKIGNSRSRDGGRDIVFYKGVDINKKPVKWIAQCKLKSDKRSLGSSQVTDILDMLLAKEAKGFCIMTSSIIDATLHDKLDDLRDKIGIQVEKWSYLEIERFLAEHPEIKARYFKD